MGYYNWANRQLENLLAKDPTYKRSAYPGMRLGLANTILKGRMGGAPQLERNLFSSQANATANVLKNATDASQALAYTTAAQAQTDEALSDLQVKEAQNKYSLIDNLNAAYDAMAAEDVNVFGDQVRRYENEAQIRGAQAANRLAKRRALWNTVGDIAGFGAGLVSAGIIKFPKIGAGSKKTPVSSNPNQGWMG